MDFLKTLALPQSTEHFHVLVLIGGLASIVLYPYLSLLLGSSLLSFVYERKGIRENKPHFVRFAKDLIDLVMVKNSVPLFLALLPSFSLIFVYAQILQSTDAISVSLSAYGFLALAAAVLALQTYKSTFRLERVLGGYQDLLKLEQAPSPELEKIREFSKENHESHLRTGRFGVMLAAVSAFLIVSASAVAADPTVWGDIDSFFDLFLSPDVLLRVCRFAAVAAGVLGTGILYFFFSWKGGRGDVDEEYSSFVRILGIRLTVASLVAQPLFILAGVYLLPGVSLSGSLYGFVGTSLIMLFVASQFVYAYVRDSKAQYLTSAFGIILAASLFLFSYDAIAIHNATSTNAALLAYRDNEATEELMAKLGVASVVLTGEDIYNGRCSACHLFDQKKIGPAYKDVIPKYAGDKSKIMAFVLNPTKKNPLFPPMPNQGLKPVEADSIVSYILRRLGGTGADSSKQAAQK